jgi:methylisocitrate lyase
MSETPKMMEKKSAGARLRAAVVEERPLQIIGAINAYHARMAERVGYRALYVSGGGVAAGSLGVPDLGISALEGVQSGTQCKGPDKGRRRRLPH